MATTAKTRTNSGITQYSGTWDSAAVLHLLRRVHFGVTKEDLDYFKGKTMIQAVDEILNIDYSVPSPPINNYNDNTADPNVAAGATWVNDYNSQLNNLRINSLKYWWAGQIINHDRTIREKMTLFWHNHFSTQSDVYNWANFGYQYSSLLRANCLKNFKSLVKDVTLDPAMLIFLNGERNTDSAPDENYSRELQELFTLGKGPDSKYTESDVIAGARVLTGWRIDKSDGRVYFQANRHDDGNKEFSSFYNGTIISGRTGDDGKHEVDDLINMIFLQNEVAKHIVRKLYRWFVYYDIDEATENNVISPLADIFRNGNYEIKPVLDKLLKSEHFYDVLNRGALIKSPVDFCMGLSRTFDVDFPSETNYVDQYRGWFYMFRAASLQQQEIADPPSVAGWPAYYQLPQYHELWVNSDTLPKRNQVTDYMAATGYNVNGYRLKLNMLKFGEKFSSITNPTQFIDDALELLHTIPVEQAQKDYMKTILLSGQLNDSYWTDAWNDYVNDKNDETKTNVVSLRLVQLFKYMMNLGEFQLS